MIFLILSVTCSSLLFILFKLFDKYQINTFQAIVVNYFTALLFGLISYSGKIVVSEIPNKAWFIGALILSFLFISVFNLMGLTSQRNGVSVASVAGKMSIVVPVIFGVYLYGEKLHLIKITGILLALIAVYLTTSKSEEKKNTNSYLFPFLLFLGSGIIDTTIKYVQDTYVPIPELPYFSAIIFGFAGMLGLIIFVFRPSKIQLKNIIGGIVLGSINYYSIIYLLKALDSMAKEFVHLEIGSGIVFTINNVAIVVFTTLLGLLLFKEKLLTKNWIGVLLAIISIFLIT
ncbi:MAG: DMT family transporter [Flavobacteriaceae bacterium]|nr:DMT family transporter [Flavobacteriaceae bacterium]